jgi:hypothetical protein
MHNNETTKTANTRSDSDTKSVILIRRNTHCAVCNKQFEVARVGKLYCSHRCKQFGFNHKNEIQEILKIRMLEYNPEIISFFIDDYVLYNKRQITLKRFKELEKKKLEWECINTEILQKQKLGIHVDEYSFAKYARYKLTENEEFELYNAESELDENFLMLQSKELSLEQWSFIKFKYSVIDDNSLFEIISSLSKEYLDQLTIKENSDSKNNLGFRIKNEFIEHCNLIANGKVQFVKKNEENN